MNEFLYVFRGGDVPEGELSPEKMQAHMQKWFDWIDVLRKNDRFIAGQPLEKGGKVVSSARKVITDGPFAEGKEVVGGYLLIRAENLDEAVELSKQCPIFERGGSVEVRAIRSLVQ